MVRRITSQTTRYKIFVIATLQFLFLIFIAWNGLDPDFGWHIKLGEHILKNGIPKTDPFSYTMPSATYIDHEWLTNIVMHLAFSHAGKLGVAALFSTFVALTFVILKTKDTDRAGHAVMLLTLASFISKFGTRPQIIGWLLIALTTKLVSSKTQWKKYRLLYPLIMILWTNTHGSFPIGLFIISVVILSKIVKNTKKNLLQQLLSQTTNIIVLTLSACAAIINPYGTKIWEEVVRQATDTNQKAFIAEWLPSASRADIAFCVASLVTLMLSFRYRHKIKLHLFIISATLLVLAITSQRHIPLFMIANTPLFLFLINKLKKEAEKYKFGKERFITLTKGFLIISLAIVLIENIFAYTSSNKMSENSFYPKTSVEYLKSKQPNGRILTTYSWAGYTLWELSDKKTFIDGRMPSFHNDKAPSAESVSALNDYIALTQKLDTTLLQKYNIQYILWPKEKENQLNFTRLNLLKKSNKTKNTFLTKIKSLGWKEVYSDHNSSIYENVLNR